MEQLSAVILAMLKFFNPSVGSNKRTQKKVRDRINMIMSTMLVLLILSLVVYAGFDLYGKYKGTVKNDCWELRQSLDTLKAQNIKLVGQIEAIKKKYDNIDIDKFPFTISPAIMADMKSRLVDIVMSVGASRGSISLFHNPIGMSINPIPINGMKTYIYASILVSVSDGYTIAYDDYLFQNIPLKLFDSWFDRYTSDGYVELNRDNVTVNDKIIFKLVLLDYERVRSAYVFGIPNMGNTREYGDFIGVLMFDFENDSKLDSQNKMKVKLFCEKVGNYLLKYRKFSK